LRADEAATPARPAKPGAGIVVDIKSDHIVLMDIALSEIAWWPSASAVSRWHRTTKARPGRPTHASQRTLTGIAFKDDKTGVAVGHGGTVIRTDDGGESWTHVPLEEAARIRCSGSPTSAAIISSPMARSAFISIPWMRAGPG
jgi:hypothetical protein